MKKVLFATHTLVFLAGLLIASAYFVFYGLPLTARYIVADPMYIKLTEDTEKENYSDILQEDYLGSLYLKHPAYFFKRQEGKDILKNLAHRGYTPASGSLFAYYITRHMYADNYEEEKRYLMDAHKWAMLAAKQGSFFDLFTLFHIFDLYDYKGDVSEELAILEKAAKASPSHVFANGLSKFYALQRKDTGNAEKWHKVAQEIYHSSYEEAPGRTIIPRKDGYYVFKP